MPWLRAVASTMGFQDEPGWRPLPPPSTVTLSGFQHVAATSTLSRTSGGAGSQLPSARFTWPCSRENSRPPTIARTKPVLGSRLTNAISMGGTVPSRALATVRSASSCRRGFNVVRISKPPA